MRNPCALWLPDGLPGGVPLPRPSRAGPRGRGGAGGRLANAVLAHLPLAVAVIDADARLLYWNEHAACLFNAPPLMAAGTPALADVLAGVAGLAPVQRDRIVDFSAAHVAAGDRTEPEGCLRLSLGHGSRIVIEIRGIGSRQWMLAINDGRSVLGSGRNLAAQGGGDAWLDALTGLSNRRHLNQALRDLIEAATPEQRHAVAMIDLDRFKPVNDAFGLATGDALLCLVAQRLRRETRDDDLLVRLGGDEFLILAANNDRAEALAARVVEALSRPFLVEGHIADIGASVGIARFPAHGNTADDLMRHAGLALLEAKSAGGGSWRVFDPRTAAADGAIAAPDAGLAGPP